MTLVTADVIEDQAIDVLGRRHPEHLAAFERQRGLAPQTIERLATVDVLIGEGVRLREDRPPVALLGVFGTSGEPEPDKHGMLTFSWVMAVQVVVIGQDRRDTIRRRSWYAMTVAQCLMARLPRSGAPVDAVSLTDVDFTNGTTTDARPRTVGEAQLTFNVRVREAMSTRDMPPDDTTFEPGTPGGPPSEPYVAPVQWPRVGTATTTTEKEPL